MPFQPITQAITWKIHLRSTPEQVFTLLATNDGRSLFWAESAMELDKSILFIFPDGTKFRGEILTNEPSKLFRVKYIGGSTASFKLESDGAKGTILTLTDENAPAADRCEVIAGWVSVLMALKAAADFNVDLRNHSDGRSWEQGFADN